MYNVCVHGTDVPGNTDANTCIQLPVYDPSAGFVTGGGKVDSPVGADLLNPSAAGQATFVFVSKYLPGRNTPSGNLQFQFKNGNLAFNSTSMDWLVVTGEPRAQFHGIGTLNGTTVSCSNGADRYKLPATAVTKGSIIHK